MLTTNTSAHFLKKAVPDWPAADLMEEGQLPTENYKSELSGSTEIGNSLLVLNTNGNSTRAEDKDSTKSCLKIIAEGFARLRQLVSERVCNKLPSVLNGNVKHFKRFFATYRNYMLIRKYLRCTKSKNG